MSIINYYKNNPKKIGSHLIILLAVFCIQPKNGRILWESLLWDDNKYLISILNAIVNLLFVGIVFFTEKKLKLQNCFENVTRNIPEHRMGTVLFCIFLLVSTCFGISAYYLYKLTGESLIVSCILPYIGMTLEYYLIYIILG